MAPDRDASGLFEDYRRLASFGFHGILLFARQNDQSGAKSEDLQAHFGGKADTDGLAAGTRINTGIRNTAEATEV